MIHIGNLVLVTHGICRRTLPRRAERHPPDLSSPEARQRRRLVARGDLLLKSVQGDAAAVAASSKL